MNSEYFIAKRIIKGTGNTHQFSRPIVRVAVLGVALGIAVMILAVAIVKGFQNEIRNKLIGFGSHIHITHYDNNATHEPTPIDKNQDFLNEIKSNPEIKHIQAFVTKSGIIKTKTENQGVVLKGVDKDYDWNYIQTNLTEGTIFSYTDTISKGIVISKQLANNLLFKLNDKVVIYFIIERSDSSGNKYTDVSGKDFYITGIYETGFEEIDNKMALVDMRRLQKINGWEQSQVAGFEVAINNFNKIDETGEELNNIVGQELIVETVKQLNTTLFSWLEMVDVNAILVLVLMILVAAINMVATLLILILERTNMIGILKALGAKNSFIQKIFMYNAVHILSKGLLWGNAIALIVEFLQLKFGIFKLNPQTYYISQVPIDFNIFHIALINIGSLLVCVLILLLPSLLVSKIKPAKAIRFN